MAEHAVERSNLLNTAKLAIKSIIETSMATGITSVDSSNEQLRQFFVIMEHVLQHGIRQKRNILGQKRTFFGVAEAMEKFLPGSGETLLSVRNMSAIRTGLGRARAWLRLVVMQKKLGDFAGGLVEHREVVDEWYEDFAFLASDDAPVISGMLVGLSVLDCNLDIRGEDLDNAPTVIDFSRFLKEGNYLRRSGADRSDSPDASGGESSGMSQVDLSLLLDQKAYLEEMNSKLKTSVDDLQVRLNVAQKCNDKLQAELDQTADRMNTISEKHEQFVNVSSDEHAGLGKKLEEVKKDIDTERQTYESARQGLNEMYAAVQKQLETEIKMREEVEREIEVQRSMKTESETAMQLMERTLHEKQDTIASLRRQLDDVKQANLAMAERLQTAEETGREKASQLDMMTISQSRLAADNERVQEQSAALQERSVAAEDTLQQLSMRYADLEAKKAATDADLVIERQWRLSIQTELQEERTKLQIANGELDQLRATRTRLDQLQRKYDDLQELCTDQEQTLVELGSRLQLSKKEAVDMRERSDQLKQSAWADDKEVTNCRQCESAFNVSRRKHHCRQCGMIYCNACSDNQMVLAASSKPVRVCDHCYTLLLQPAVKKS